MNLRNEILPVKELKSRFVTGKIKMLQLSSETTNSIEKSVVLKRGFTKVTGLRIQDMKNEKFDKSRAGERFYNQTEYTTRTEWIFE